MKEIKKARQVNQASFRYWEIFLLAIGLTYLATPKAWMELAPFLRFAQDDRANARQVVKASMGHYPQPFLIRCYKRTCAKIRVEVMRGKLNKSFSC